jgi:hypothetical protein
MARKSVFIGCLNHLRRQSVLPWWRLNGIRRVSTVSDASPSLAQFMRSARAASAAHAILSRARHGRQAISCVRNCWLTESAFNSPITAAPDAY